MGHWKNVSKPGAKEASAAGVQTRLTASGYQVWVDDEVEQMAAEEQAAMSAPAASLLDTPVKDLAAALAQVDDYTVVKAAARDKRATARPIYRARLGGGEAEE